MSQVRASWPLAWKHSCHNVVHLSWSFTVHTPTAPWCWQLWAPCSPNTGAPVLSTAFPLKAFNDILTSKTEAFYTSALSFSLRKAIKYSEINKKSKLCKLTHPKYPKSLWNALHITHAQRHFKRKQMGEWDRQPRCGFRFFNIYWMLPVCQALFLDAIGWW